MLPWVPLRSPTAGIRLPLTRFHLACYDSVGWPPFRGLAPTAFMRIASVTVNFLYLFSILISSSRCCEKQSRECRRLDWRFCHPVVPNSFFLPAARRDIVRVTCFYPREALPPRKMLDSPCRRRGNGRGANCVTGVAAQAVGRPRPFENGLPYIALPFCLEKTSVG